MNIFKSAFTTKKTTTSAYAVPTNPYTYSIDRMVSDIMNGFSNMPLAAVTTAFGINATIESLSRLGYTLDDLPWTICPWHK